MLKFILFYSLVNNFCMEEAIINLRKPLQLSPVSCPVDYMYKLSVAIATITDAINSLADLKTVVNSNLNLLLY